MYLTINNTRHSVSKRIVSGKTIKYLSVTPAPESISGTISMYRDDGFLMSEDNADTYVRKSYVGTLLQISNDPEPQPVIQRPSLESQVATLKAENESLRAQLTDTEEVAIELYEANLDLEEAIIEIYETMEGMING